VKISSRKGITGSSLREISRQSNVSLPNWKPIAFWSNNLEVIIESGFWSGMPGLSKDQCGWNLFNPIFRNLSAHDTLSDGKGTEHTKDRMMARRALLTGHFSAIGDITCLEIVRHWLGKMGGPDNVGLLVAPSPAARKIADHVSETAFGDAS
jgi:hypothetical protein